MNAKYKALYNNWKNATMTKLSDAYKRPSEAKIRAYEWCMNDYKRLNGTDFRICSKNTFGFTCAFLFNDPYAGSALSLYYATKDNLYIFKV